jgi:hypothetical protein
VIRILQQRHAECTEFCCAGFNAFRNNDGDVSAPRRQFLQCARAAAHDGASSPSSPPPSPSTLSSPTSACPPPRRPSPRRAARPGTTSPSMPIPASISTRRPRTTRASPSPSRTSTSIRAPAPDAQPRPSATVSALQSRRSSSAVPRLCHGRRSSSPAVPRGYLPIPVGGSRPPASHAATALPRPVSGANLGLKRRRWRLNFLSVSLV